MGQVTIYMRDSALDAAKEAATQAKVSVSQWFAAFAEEQERRHNANWTAFFAEIDKNKDIWQDFPSQEEIRANEVPDRPLEAW